MALSAMFILEVVIVFSFIITSLFMFIPKKNEVVHKIFFCIINNAGHTCYIYKRNITAGKYEVANRCLLDVPCSRCNSNNNFSSKK